MLDSLIKISSNYYRNKVIEALKVNVSLFSFRMKENNGQKSMICLTDLSDP